MMSLLYVFWMLVIIFAVIGLLRGWAKELLVAFSLILGLTLNHVLRKYIPVVQSLPDSSVELFWTMTSVVIALVFFGYQTVALVPHLQSKATRERLQDALFGLIVGGINGYLIAGTILYYLAQTNYQVFPGVIDAPSGPAAEAFQRLMTYAAPHLFGEPGIYFAVIVCFVFVIVVYI
jgi:uncharacterized membrane protein required for colicin V production